jgi:hypothetical protein
LLWSNFETNTGVARKASGPSSVCGASIACASIVGAFRASIVDVSATDASVVDGAPEPLSLHAERSDVPAKIETQSANVNVTLILEFICEPRVRRKLRRTPGASNCLLVAAHVTLAHE